MSLNPISGLPTQIKLPSDFTFIDPNNLRDYIGNQITDNPIMPHVTFSGFEGSGQVNVTIPTNAVNQYKVEATVLRPYIGSGTTQYKQYLDATSQQA